MIRFLAMLLLVPPLLIGAPEMGIAETPTDRSAPPLILPVPRSASNSRLCVQNPIGMASQRDGIATRLPLTVLAEGADGTVARRVELLLSEGDGTVEACLPLSYGADGAFTVIAIRRYTSFVEGPDRTSFSNIFGSELEGLIFFSVTSRDPNLRIGVRDSNFRWRTDGAIHAIDVSILPKVQLYNRGVVSSLAMCERKVVAGDSLTFIC